MKLKRISFFIFIVSIGVDVNAAEEEDPAKCYLDFCVTGVVNRTDLTFNKNDFFQVTGEGPDAKLNVLKGFNLETSKKFFTVEIQTQDASKPKIYSGTQVPLCKVLGAQNANPYPIDRRLLLMIFGEYTGCSDEPKEYPVPMSFSGMFSLETPICDEFQMIVKVSNDAESETPDLTMTVNVTPDKALGCANGTSSNKMPETDTVVVVKKVPKGSQSDPGSGSNPDSTSAPEAETDPTEKLVSEIENNNGKGPCEGSDCVYGTVTRISLEGSKNKYFKVTGKKPDQKLSVLQGFNNFESDPQEVEITIQSSEHQQYQVFWSWYGPLCPSELDLETDPYPIQKKLLQMLFGEHKSCADDPTPYPVPKGFAGMFTMDWEPKPTNFQLDMIIASNGDDSMVEVRMKVNVTLSDPPVEKAPGMGRLGVTGEIGSDGKPEPEISADEYGKCGEYVCIYGNATRTALFSSDDGFIKVNGEGPSATISLRKPIDEYNEDRDPVIRVSIGAADGAGKPQTIYSGINEVCRKLPKYNDTYLISQQVIRMFFRDYDGCKLDKDEYSVSMGFAGLISFEKTPPCGEFEVILEISEGWKSKSKATMIVKVVPDDISGCSPKETTTSEPESTTTSEEDAKSTAQPTPEITAADIAKCEKRRRFCISGNATRIAFYSKDDDFVKVNGEGPDATFSLPKGIDEHGTDPGVQVSLRTYDDMDHPKRIIGRTSPFCIFLPSLYQDPYLIEDQLVRMFFSEYDGCEVKQVEYSVSMGFSGLMSFAKPPPTCDKFQVILIIYNVRQPTSAVVMIVEVVPDNALGCLRKEPTTSEPESTTAPEVGSTSEPEDESERTTASESPEGGSEPTTTSESTESGSETTTMSESPEVESEATTTSESTESGSETTTMSESPEVESEATTTSESTESGFEATTMSESPGDVAEPTTMAEPEAQPTAEPEVTAADIAQCERKGRFCISGNATRIAFYSKDDDFVKVNGEGPDATFSLPKGIDEHGTDPGVQVSLRTYDDMDHQTRIIGKSNPFCIFLPSYGDPYLIEDQLVRMFFSEYDGCEVKQEEYSVPMGFSGLMSFAKPPPTCDKFQVILIIYNPRQPTSAVVMIVEVVPDNALGCLREEPTTSEPESTTAPQVGSTSEPENESEPTTVSESPEGGSEPTTTSESTESGSETTTMSESPEVESEATTTSESTESGSETTTMSESPGDVAEPTTMAEPEAQPTAEPEVTAADIAKCERKGRFCISGNATRIAFYSKDDDFVKVNGEGPDATFSLPKGIDEHGTDPEIRVFLRTYDDMDHPKRIIGRTSPFCIFLPSLYQDPYLIEDQLVRMFFSEYDGCEVKQEEYSVSMGFSGLMSFPEPPPTCDKFQVILLIHNSLQPTSAVVMIVEVVPDNALGCLREEPTTFEPESTTAPEAGSTSEPGNESEPTTVSESPEIESKATTTSESTESGSETTTMSESPEVESEATTTSESTESGSETTTMSESPEVESEASTTSESTESGSETTTMSESPEVESEPTTTSESTESGSETTTMSESPEVASEATTTSESTESGSEPPTTSESSEHVSEATTTSESDECGSGPIPMRKGSGDVSERTTTTEGPGDKSEPMPNPTGNSNCTYFEWLKNLPSFTPDIRLYSKWLSDHQCVPAREMDNCSYFDWLRNYPSYIPSVSDYRRWEIYNNCESVEDDSGDSTESTCNDDSCVYAMVTRTCLRTSKNDIFNVQGSGVSTILSLLPGFNVSSPYNIEVYIKKTNEPEPKGYQEFYKERISIHSALADDARTKRPIQTKILEMLFDEYEKSSHEEKEYKVPMGFSGQFSVSVKPDYGVYEVLLRISEDPDTSKADLTMTVEMELTKTDELGIKQNPESEPTSTPGPKLGEPNCSYFEWLRNLPSFVPDVKDYYLWLVGYGCVPESDDTTGEENSTPKEEDSAANSNCDYFVWLNNFPSYIPSATVYREWINTNGCADRESSILETLFGNDSQSDGDTKNENNKCENGFCVSAWVTKTGLTTSDDNNIFKVNGTGEGATLSLLEGFNDSATYTIEVDTRIRNESGEDPGEYQKFFETRAPLNEAVSEEANTDLPIIGRMLDMLFGQYEESVFGKKEYVVPEGFSGKFLLAVKPEYGDYDVILKVTQDPDSSTPDLTMTAAVRLERTDTLENQTESKPEEPNCDYYQWLRAYPSFIPDVKDYFNWLITNGCFDKPKVELGNCDYFEWLRKYPTFIPSTDDYRKWVERHGCIYREKFPIGQLIGNDSANALVSSGPNDSRGTVSGGRDLDSLISGITSNRRDSENSSDSGTADGSEASTESNGENTTSGSDDTGTDSDCSLIQTVISYLPFTSNNCDSGTNDSNDAENGSENGESAESNTENSEAVSGATETTSNCNIIQNAISFLPFTSNNCDSESNDSNDAESGSENGESTEPNTENSGAVSGETETTSNCNIIQNAISFLPFTSNNCDSETNDSNDAESGSENGESTESNTENSAAVSGETETTSNCNIIQNAISFLPFTSNNCDSESNDSNDAESGSENGEGAESNTENSGAVSGETETTSNCNIIQTAISFLPFTSNCDSTTTVDSGSS